MEITFAPSCSAFSAAYIETLPEPEMHTEEPWKLAPLAFNASSMI